MILYTVQSDTGAFDDLIVRSNALPRKGEQIEIDGQIHDVYAVYHRVLIHGHDARIFVLVSRSFDPPRPRQVAR